MEPEKIIWTGKSGLTYTYYVYVKGTTFKKSDGNYIFAKKTTNGWDAVYIGEGDFETRPQDEEHLKCAEKKGFTHYHVHLNSNETNRKAEETDMIQGNQECLIENGGCNKTATGK